MKNIHLIATLDSAMEIILGRIYEECSNHDIPQPKFYQYNKDRSCITIHWNYGKLCDSSIEIVLDKSLMLYDLSNGVMVTQLKTENDNLEKVYSHLKKVLPHLASQPIPILNSYRGEFF